MFKSWKSRAAVFAVAATMAGAVLGLASPAGADAGGNSANAHACQQGGWQHLFRSDGTSFANQGACVSYAARGGTLKSAQQLECESLGGTYAVGTGLILWTCTNLPVLPVSTLAEIEVFDARLAALAGVPQIPRLLHVQPHFGGRP